MTDFKKGDRVRVTFEAEVKYVGPGGVDLKTEKGWASLYGLEGIDIEVLPPPVEQFQPGDWLRNKYSGVLIVLGERGYYSSRTRDHHLYGKLAASLSSFTSERYEKVELP